MVRLGCLVLLVVALVAAWLNRGPLVRAATRLVGRAAPLPSVADSTVGAPTPTAVEGAEAKLAMLGRATQAPDSVVLTPNEVASWIGSGIDWSVRKTYDSLRVELRRDTLVLHARLDTRAVPPEALGPLAGILEPREPLRVAGPLTLARPGVVRFEVTELSVRDLRFPSAAVHQAARRVAGADADGGFPVPVVPAVRAVAVRPTGLVLYRVPPGADHP